VFDDNGQQLRRESASELRLSVGPREPPPAHELPIELCGKSRHSWIGKVKRLGRAL
jgi:hypothetical protein